MRNKNGSIRKGIFISTVIIMIALSFSACGGTSSYYTSEEAVREPLDVSDRIPTADGNDTYNGSVATVDYSNAFEGYIMVKYTGSHSGKIKMQIKGPSYVDYTYDLTAGVDFESFPLTEGSGNYYITIYEQISGNQYSVVDSTSVSASIEDDFSPFLYSNQYVNFTAESTAVKDAKNIYAHTATDLEFVTGVYNYTMDNIDYDNELAEEVDSGAISGYLPKIDEVISTGKGICFDYAVLMASMLRSQNVPTKLQIGYSGEVYHAWISVYTEEEGWIEDIIQFNGSSWSLMDPTFGDTIGESELRDYVGNGENYVEKFIY